MLKIECDKCGEELKKEGFLLFSPPWLRASTKYHLCVMCGLEVEAWIHKDDDKWG